MPFLTSLADWCREAAAPYGVAVEEYPGWQTRGRSGGSPYSSGRPWCVMWHHTASSDQTLADYHATESDNAPVCNLDIKSNGTIVVIAAGPTNTNGKGSGTRNTSKGTVPIDSMNSYALGIEFYNNGVGQSWPQIQIDVGFAVVCTVQRKLGLQPTDLFTHEGYAPDRKVDPATADAVQGPWRPRSKNSSGTWNDDDLRDENTRRFFGTVPQPEPGGTDLAAPASFIDDNGDGWVFWQGTDESLWMQYASNDAYSLGGRVTDRISAVCAGNVVNIHAYAPDGDLYLWQFRDRNLVVDRARVG